MGTTSFYVWTLCLRLGAVCCSGLRTLLVSSHLMKFIIGTKAGMTQVFDENGVCKAATILKVEPAKVSQVKMWKPMATLQYRLLLEHKRTIVCLRHRKVILEQEQGL